MAQQQIEQLKKKLQQKNTQFQNYKTQCKQYEQFLQKQSNKKQQQIRKLKEEAIKRQKNYGLLKTQVSQLQTQNTALKTQIGELNQIKNNAKASGDKNGEYLKQIQEVSKRNQELVSECQVLKKNISVLEKKIQEQATAKVSKGKQASESNSNNQNNTKKLQQALSASKAKISQLQKNNQKLKQQLSKKSNIKQLKSEEKDKQKGKDNHNNNHKQQQKLKQRIQKLEKRLTDNQSHASKLEQTNTKLSKNVKQLKNKLALSDTQKQSLNKRIKELINSNSNKKRQQRQKTSKQKQQYDINQQDENQQQKQTNKQSHLVTNYGNIYSALVLTKKHYVSPFLQFKNDNSVKIYKNTKNGSFQKSLGTIKYKLNDISYNNQQIIQNCVKSIKEDIENSVKSSVILFGPKKTTKKYMLANLISKLKEFIFQKLSQEYEFQAVFISASPDPEKKIQMHAHNKQQLQQIINKIIDNAQKSPKKAQNPIKTKNQPKPKARYFKLVQQQLYLQIITTSFTNFPLRQNLTPTQALNNIAYSRLPNALQPTDCHRQIILILNPIVSLYDQCKNTLSITNCKNISNTQSESAQPEQRNSRIKQQLLNDTARKKLQNSQRQSQQYLLKMRRQEQDILFYRNKFDELQVRLKNLVNTHRQQNSYLKKSPVILSYEKMLKFVHSVQAKNHSHGHSSTLNVEQNKINQVNEDNNDYQEGYHQEIENQGEEDIL